MNVRCGGLRYGRAGLGVSMDNVEHGLAIGARSAVRKYDAHVVVVGSGAGGAPAALRLRECGFDVLLLEEGGIVDPVVSRARSADTFRRVYRDAGAGSTSGDPPILLREARAVGGSSVLGEGIAFRAPDPVLESWAFRFKIDGVDTASMAPYFEEAESLLGVAEDESGAGSNAARLFLTGARELGWTPSRVRRIGAADARQGPAADADCIGLTSEVGRALSAGARLVTNARVNTVITDGRRARGVSGEFVDSKGRRHGAFEVSARLVVLAAGAKHSPAILKRSGLGGNLVGNRIHLQPRATVAGAFPFDLETPVGTPTAYEVHDYLGEGLVFGYDSPTPAELAPRLAGCGTEHAERMADYPRLLAVSCTMENLGRGTLSVGPGSRVGVRYRLHDRDIELVHRGIRMAAEHLFAAGATSVYLPFERTPEARSVDDLRYIDHRKSVRADLILQAHNMVSSCNMSSSPSRGPCDVSGRVRGIAGVVVADAGILPSAIGIHPLETIVAMSLRNADRWIDQLVRERRRRYEAVA